MMSLLQIVRGVVVLVSAQRKTNQSRMEESNHIFITVQSKQFIIKLYRHNNIDQISDTNPL